MLSLLATNPLLICSQLWHEKRPLVFYKLNLEHKNGVMIKCLEKPLFRPDLKNMLVCRHLGLFFSSTPSWLEKNFLNQFEMEKIALILIYNIFVTKKIFFSNENQKNFLICTFLVDLLG